MTAFYFVDFAYDGPGEIIDGLVRWVEREDKPEFTWDLVNHPDVEFDGFIEPEDVPDLPNLIGIITGLNTLDPDGEWTTGGEA